MLVKNIINVDFAPRIITKSKCVSKYVEVCEKCKFVPCYKGMGTPTRHTVTRNDYMHQILH